MSIGKSAQFYSIYLLLYKIISYMISFKLQILSLAFLI